MNTPLSRRAFLQGSALFLSGLPLLACRQREEAEAPRTLRLGLLTDLHHAPGLATRGTRCYPDTPAKLEKSLAWLGSEAGPDGLQRLIQLGDLVDGGDDPAADDAALREMAAQLAAPGWPVRHIVGNHCQASLSKAGWCAATGQAATTFSEVVRGWRLVGLDACHRTDGTPYPGAGPRDWRNTAVPPAQLAWLEAELARDRRPLLLFIHQPLAGFAPGHGVVNQAAVRALLRPHAGRIGAVFQGHTHQNALHQVDGIPYVTLRATIEDPGLSNAAAGLLTVEPDGSMKLQGFRRQKDWARARASRPAPVG